jgi:hypothetical protein
MLLPNRGPAPPRQPQPGEQVWRLRPLLLVAARELVGAYRSSTIVGLDRAPIDAGLPIPDPAQASSPATSSSPNAKRARNGVVAASGCAVVARRASV